MKKLFLPVIAMMSVLMLAACGGAGPEKTVDDFMGSVKSFDVENLDKNLSKELSEEYEESFENQDVVDDELSFDDVKEFDEYKDLEGELKKLTGKLKHKIVDTETDGDKSTVKVEVEYANASEPLINSIQSMFGQLMGLAFSGEEPDEEEVTKVMLESVTDSLKDAQAAEEIKIEKATGEIKLAKEDKVWVITEIDDDVSNALLFGILDGLESFDPFGIEGGFEGELEEENFEVNEDIFD